MASASKIRELEGKLKEAEEKIAYLEKISKLETEVKEAHTEKISQLELKLKESLQSNADCTAKVSGLEQRLQQTERMKRDYETSFNATQSQLGVASRELDIAKAKVLKKAIDDDAKLEMIRALLIICGKNESIMVKYIGTLDIDGWHSSTEHKHKYWKTFADFKCFWDARQGQKTFDHLLKIDYHEGTLEYMIHDANQEISKLHEEHRLMATRVENMYLRIVLWNIRKVNLIAFPWNYDKNRKATRVEVLDHILEVITSKYRRVKRRW